MSLDLRNVVARLDSTHDEKATQTWERGDKVTSTKVDGLLKPLFFAPVALRAASHFLLNGAPE